MSPLPLESSTDEPAVESIPFDILAYERWLAERTISQPSESYLFLEPRVRFSPEADDALTLAPGVTFAQQQDSVALYHTSSGTSIAVGEVDAATCKRIVDAINGQRSLIAVQIAARATQSEMDAFLRATFGKVVLCPNTVNQLAKRISVGGLVRFPGSPYEINRNYWTNMADVRDRYLECWCRKLTRTELGRCLKELHVLSLIGADGRSFYRPSSPIVAKSGARPGAFYNVATRTLRDLERTLIVAGPRVSAPLVGGRSYHEQLFHSLDDAMALDPEREISIEGIVFGRLIWGQARSDPEPGAWFIPPRPLTEPSLNLLCEAHNQALTPTHFDSSAFLDAVASFHYRFVRLHPFSCANQSLAMNLVSAMLSARGLWDVPHLLLDHWALRVSEPAYRRLFRRFVRNWSLGDTAPDRRPHQLVSQRITLDRFVTAMGQTQSRGEAAALLRASPDAAALALLVDG